MKDSLAESAPIGAYGCVGRAPVWARASPANLGRPGRKRTAHLKEIRIDGLASGSSGLSGSGWLVGLPVENRKETYCAHRPPQVSGEAERTGDDAEGANIFWGPAERAH